MLGMTMRADRVEKGLKGHAALLPIWYGYAATRSDLAVCCQIEQPQDMGAKAELAVNLSQRAFAVNGWSALAVDCAACQFGKLKRRGWLQLQRHESTWLPQEPLDVALMIHRTIVELRREGHEAAAGA